MTRKIISALLALILCFSLAISVSAEARAFDFVVDEIGYLAESEVAELNDLALDIYNKTGVGIFYIYTWEADIENFDIGPYVGDLEHFYVIVENETSWYSVLSGKASVLDYDTEIALRDIYDLTDTYVAGVRDFLCAAAEYFPQIEVTEPEAVQPADTQTEAAQTEVPQIEDVPKAEEYFLYDEADLVPAENEAALIEKLAQVSHTYDAQLVICTIPSLEGDIDEYLHYLYDSMGFGYGENKDGALLLICMDPRQYRILSNGYAGVAIGPEQVDRLCDFMDTYLPNCRYVAAFNSFADESGYMLDGYLNGYSFDVLGNLITSLVIGLIAGLITAFVLKGQLKTVRKQHRAHDYVKPDSMQLTLRHDIFLYRTVTETRKESRSESNSGSDSGSSRTTGGGSF